MSNNILQFHDPKQPDKCLYYDGVTCGYPIEACTECPLHEYLMEDAE